MEQNFKFTFKSPNASFLFAFGVVFGKNFNFKFAYDGYRQVLIKIVDSLKFIYPLSKHLESELVNKTILLFTKEMLLNNIDSRFVEIIKKNISKNEMSEITKQNELFKNDLKNVNSIKNVFSFRNEFLNKAYEIQNTFLATFMVKRHTKSLNKVNTLKTILKDLKDIMIFNIDSYLERETQKNMSTNKSLRLIEMFSERYTFIDKTLKILMPNSIKEVIFKNMLKFLNIKFTKEIFGLKNYIDISSEKSILTSSIIQFDTIQKEIHKTLDIILDYEHYIQTINNPKMLCDFKNVNVLKILELSIEQKTSFKMNLMELQKQSYIDKNIPIMIENIDKEIMIDMDLIKNFDKDNLQLENLYSFVEYIIEKETNFAEMITKILGHERKKTYKNIKKSLNRRKIKLMQQISNSKYFCKSDSFEIFKNDIKSLNKDSINAIITNFEDFLQMNTDRNLQELTMDIAFDRLTERHIVMHDPKELIYQTTKSVFISDMQKILNSKVSKDIDSKIFSSMHNLFRLEIKQLSVNKFVKALDLIVEKNISTNQNIFLDISNTFKQIEIEYKKIDIDKFQIKTLSTIFVFKYLLKSFSKVDYEQFMLLLDKNFTKEIDILEGKLFEKNSHDIMKLMWINYIYFSKRWRFLPDSMNGPDDSILLPPRKFKDGTEDILEDTDLGNLEIPVDLNIFLDVITWLETLAYSNRLFYAGSMCKESITHIVNQVYEWLFLESSEPKPDHWRIYQMIKWIGEGIIANNINNPELNGYKVVNELINELVKYYENHHGIRIIEYDPNGNYMYNTDLSIIDKLKSIRHRFIKEKGE